VSLYVIAFPTRRSSDLAEVVLFDREVVEIGGGVQEVDRVQDAAAHRELDRIHVVAQRLDQRPRVLYGVLAQRALHGLRDLVSLLDRKSTRLNSSHLVIS